MTALPKSLEARSDRAAIWEDIAPYREMTASERARALSELCAWARDALDANPQAAKAWAWEDKRSAESLALWRRLVTAARR
jgi:hypothetical protein